MSRFIGLDHGSRRIGVAIAESETGLAFARPALRAGDLDQLVTLAANEGADLLVIGLPRNMDGSEGPQADAARRFGDQLAALGLAVTYQDERLSSWQAGELLSRSGRTPVRQSGELDSAAARVILQDYLDAQARPRAQQETE